MDTIAGIVNGRPAFLSAGFNDRWSIAFTNLYSPLGVCREEGDVFKKTFSLSTVLDASSRVEPSLVRLPRSRGDVNKQLVNRKTNECPPIAGFQPTPRKNGNP